MQAMLAETSSAELAEWIAFDQLEPIGPVRGDYQAALIARTVASQYAKKPPKIEDFLIRFDREDEDANVSAQRVKDLVRGVAPVKRKG